MKITFKHTVAIVLSVSSGLIAEPVDYIASQPAGPGIIHHHEYRAAGPWHLQVLEIDLTDSLIHLETVKAGDNVSGYERTSAMSARNDAEGHRVVGAINGDFYATGGIPIGTQIIQGEILKEPYPRSTFSIDIDKKPYIDIVSFTGQLIAANDSSTGITNVNTARATDNLIVYNDYFGATSQTNYWGTEVIALYINDQQFVNSTTQVVVTNKDSITTGEHGNNAIPSNGIVLSGHGISATFLNEQVFIGDTLTCILNMPPITAPLVEMIGGMPRLIRNSIATVEWDAEGTSYSFAHDRHPRTAVGFNQDSTKVYFFTVDGRQAGYSTGMSLFELANYMLEWGVTQGINLDGGGSTTMVVRGNVVNSPSDGGGERSVANALMVISMAPTGSLAILSTSPEEAYVIVESQAQFSVSGFDQHYNPVPIFSDSVTWSCNPAIGTIDSSGRFTAGTVEGDGYIFAAIGSVVDSSHVYVTDIATIELSPAPVILEVGQEQLITPHALDTYGNLITMPVTDYAWSATDSIGQISNSGTFLATHPGTGFVWAVYHAIAGSCAVSVGISLDVVVDDFTTITNWSLSGVNVNLAGCNFMVDDSVATSVPTAGRLDYSLTTGGTSALYLNCSIPISGTPQAIGIYVYGDGREHWLRGEFQDADGEKFLLNFTDAAPGIDWTGEWHYLEIPFDDAIIHWGNPNAVLSFPITWKRIYLVEIDDAKKDAGTIYLDDFKVTFISMSADQDGKKGILAQFSLNQNYPNPFNPTTVLEYRVASRTTVNLTVHNLLGQSVKILVQETKSVGEYSVVWDGTNDSFQQVAAGIYLAHIQTPEYSQTRKMVLIR